MSADTITLASFATPIAFGEDLPQDDGPNTPRQVFDACTSAVEPTPVAAPSIIGWSSALAAELGLPPDPNSISDAATVLGGNAALGDVQAFAACYGGHQFGHWAGQLGDGRAMTIGGIRDIHGTVQELQLKGVGPTPYSRRADGRAVLRSSVREFLCSEAMHHLGVPTTRALSLVTSGDSVMRDMFYDGNAAAEPGAIVCRVAPSFLRFGSFELPAARGDEQTLRAMGDFALRQYFPDLLPTQDPNNAIAREAYTAMFAEVCRRTAETVVQWMALGFVHGVMNTDNMSLLGLTIDYGPYGWLDAYDPSWTPNTTDAANRRYRYANQPQVAGWNLQRLAEALSPLVGAIEPLAEAFERYGETLGDALPKAIAAKLGLSSMPAGDENDEHSGAWLFGELQQILTAERTDMTLFYRLLADVPTGEGATDEALLSPLADAFYEPDAMSHEHCARLARWLRRLGDHARIDAAMGDSRRSTMLAANPAFILRNHVAQEVIDAATLGDYAPFQQVLACLQTPYEARPEFAHLRVKQPEWARTRAGCSMLSCSS